MALVCYVDGDKFPSSAGGETTSSFGAIGLLPNGAYMVHNRMSVTHEASTLQQAKAYCLTQWPGCSFKTPEECRQELVENNETLSMLGGFQ